MTANEQAAFNAGIETVRQMALIAAVTIEARDDARDIRQRAASAALQGLAAGAAHLLPSTIDPALAIMRTIAHHPDQAGTMPCPTCAGTVQWMKDASNGHIHAACEAAECIRVMQ